MKPFRYPLVLALVLLAMLWTVRLPGAEPAGSAQGKGDSPIFAGAKIGTVPGAKTGTAPEEPASADVPLVGDEVRELMQDRNYAEAIKAIDKAAQAEGAPKYYLAYLKGRALYLNKQYDEAVAAFDALQEQFQDSPWARRARFGKALALARKGDFRSAELIVRSEAEYLLSDDRKQQIADIYLEFADSYFKPPKETDKPDYKKALEFYNKALEVGPKPEKRVEVELLVAQCQQKLGDLGNASGLYERFIKDHADSPLDIEARYRLGECRLAQGNLKEARRTWEDLLAKYPDSTSERIAEAMFQLSRTWQIPTPAGDEQLSRGTAALEAFIERFPTHKLAGQAHLEIAESQIHCGRYEDAVASLRRFLGDQRYQDREELADARNLLGRSYQLQKKYSEALAAWREYLAKHPAHKAWSEVQRQIVETEYLMAAEKLQNKEYEAARKMLTEFLAKYPLDGRNPGIYYLFGQMNYQQEKWEEAIADWRRLVSKYPGTNEASHAQFSIAETLEKKLGKLEEALEEYRKVTWGSHQGPAGQAIARLTAKTMTVATERVFRSNEVPKLKLTTRNIESVTVRAYKVDLETYFRKMHLARGVESLDIALIDPDKTFEFKVPNYAKHQELESEVEVPLPDGATSGVLAVTVSSKTLEATTLVVQSDLDIIIKSSRDEVFAFAENMRTGKPWPGVRLLISNGSQVFAEATTGDDGVFQKSFKELKSAGDVRVFAIASDEGPGTQRVPGGAGGAGEGESRPSAPTPSPSSMHVASNVIGLKGVEVAQGLSDKGYIYTDRPAYRAGQLVHLRGCLRRAKGDVYTIEKDKKYTVEVFDSRNRLVRQEEVKLGPFGSFHMYFPLPASSPQGQYRVLVRDEEGKSYQGALQVHEYQLEPVQLVIDVPRTVYYRGEDVEGTIRAVYYYGAPLADREIRYQLAGERTYTARTDAKGEVHFKLPTRDFQETQVLPLVAMLPERNLVSGTNIVLASQGFGIGLSTVRPVYVAGETFEVTVNTNDAEGKPTGKKLTLKVLQQTVVQGKVGERLVEEHELETAEKDGSARQTLKLEKGGRYVLRAEGIDRFKNPISGQYVVQVSDDKDEVRLRILADAHTFKVGDTAAVNLHWRGQPALSLVTFQGARVLDYKLVELKTGANELKIPMTASLAPNFELSVALMTDPPAAKEAGERATKSAAGASSDEDPQRKPVKRFHTASSPFTVERDLRVTIAAHKAGADGQRSTGSGSGALPAEGVTVRPGEKLEVSITTTDPQGKPVAAEVSLAMVEQSLLKQFPSQVPAIQDFFRGVRRRSAVRTTSSITFAYSPTTRQINRRLLAEADRLEVVREEEESREKELRVYSLDTGVVGNLAAAAAPPVALGEPVPAETAPAHDAFGLATAPVGPFGGVDLVQPEAAKPARPSSPAAMDARALGLQGVATPELQARLAFGDAKGEQMRFRGTQVAAGRMLSRSGGAGAFHFTDGVDFSGLAESSLKRSDASLWDENGDVFYARPSVQNLERLAEYDNVQVVILDGKGNMQQWGLAHGATWDRQSAEAMSQELSEVGAVLLPGLTGQETGYWNPAVVTGEDGKATVTFIVPERSTAWTLLAKGITGETLAGEATDQLVVKKELFGQLKLPMAFTDGDKAEVAASVHNDLVEKGKIEVTLKTTIAGRTVEDKKTIDVKGKGIEELSFPVELKRPGGMPSRSVGMSAGVPPAVVPGDASDAMPPGGEGAAGSAGGEVNITFELTVAAGDKKDTLRRTIPLKPYGMPVFATASGSATSDTTAWVEAPKDMALEQPSLQILVGPSVEQSLMDIVFGPAPPCQQELGRISVGLESTTSDLMASLGLQKLWGATGGGGMPSRSVGMSAAVPPAVVPGDASDAMPPGGPQAQALDGRIRSALGLLVSAQNDDGGWSWTGRSGDSRPYGSSRIVWALALARAAGYTVPEDCFNKALGYLQNQVAATPNSDYESKAILLHALSVAGQGDFALANRLYRNRPALSSGALAYLALAFAEMDRKPTAKELLDLLAQQNLDDPASRRTAERGCLPWSNASAELRALFALALQEAEPSSPKVKELVDWLLAHRTGHRWVPDKATGPAALALCQWFAQTRFEAQRYKLAVFVNDVLAKELDVDPAAGTQVIDVPGKLLKEGKQRVNFQLSGRGRYTYQCILGGFVPAEKVKSTTNDWHVERTYEPAPLEVDGREIARGFDVLQGSYSTFRNPLTQVPVGRRGLVELHIWREGISSNTPEQELEYLVITEPIPSGMTVIEKSVSGPFERFEVSPGAITFYVGSRRSIGTIHYELYGYLPGGYQVGPTVIRNAHRPEQLVVSKPKALTVLPLGQQSSDKYRLTPKELYELGKHHFGKGDWKDAQKSLVELVEKWNLQPEVYKQAVQMLLDAYLETGPAAQVVRYFEIIKEKWPSEEIPFAKILKVGAAYHEMGEYERSYLVFRATVQNSFMRESGVAGFLESQGEFARSVEVMGRLLREYPPEGYLASATYALAQRVYAKAPEAAGDEKLRKAKINRVDLIRRAWTMLEGFLTAYPEDPAADQAAFSAANALLELEAYKEATAACNRYAKRYPKSELLDSYWYMIGYCQFATGQHQAALEMCRKVAEATRIDEKTGREVESRNKWRAIYILGQVYHSLGEAAEAIKEYRRVADRFADAKQSIEYFTRKAIELPEVTTVKPGAAAEVELKFRNIPTCDTKVYRIDLMKFSLLKKNLGGITKINLAGIRPYYEATLELGDGKDYRDRTHKLALPLKEEGAYLVVCRGEDLHASGLVLVTPLAVEVQEEVASGRVRTTVKDAAAGRYLSDVHVKVIGSHNDDFKSGQTDLRGVFVADGIQGTSTVIAEADGSRYAFFRGQTELAVPPAPPAVKAEKAGTAKAPAAAATLAPSAELLEGLKGTNINLQQEQVDQLQKMYKSAPAGLPAEAAF